MRFGPNFHTEHKHSQPLKKGGTGLAAFVVNVMSGAWIKYSPFTRISVAATVIMSLAMIYLIQLHFRWAPYLRSRIQSGMNFSEQVEHLFSGHASKNALPRTMQPINDTVFIFQLVKTDGCTKRFDSPCLFSSYMSSLTAIVQDIQPVGLPFDWHLPPKRAVNSQQRDQRVQTSQKKLSETLHRLNSLGMSRSRAMRKEWS